MSLAVFILLVAVLLAFACVILLVFRLGIWLYIWRSRMPMQSKHSRATPSMRADHQAEDALTPEERRRLTCLRRRLHAHENTLTCGLDERRLRFARWLIAHERLNEGVDQGVDQGMYTA